MHVAVVGAGAIGSFVASTIADGGGDVTLIARGERLAWLRRNPVEIETGGAVRAVRVPVAAWAGLSRPVDLAFLCTKTPDLRDSLRALAGHLAPGGMVFTLQNGVEAPDAAAQAFPDAAILAGRVHGFFEMAGQRVRHVGVAPSLSWGCLRGEPEAVEATVARVLDRAGLPHDIRADIVTALWEKLLLSAALGGLAAAEGIAAGHVCKTAQGETTLGLAMREIVALGRSRGARLDDGHVEASLTFVRGFPAEATTSLQRDLEAGRPSEHDALVGAVLRIARAAGLAMPVMTAIGDRIASRYPAAVATAAR